MVEKLAGPGGRRARRVSVATRRRARRPGHSLRRRLWFAAAGVGAALAAIVAYGAFMIYQFQHSIYHPLPGVAAAAVATRVTSPAPTWTAQPAGSDTPTPMQTPTEAPAALPVGRIN